MDALPVADDALVESPSFNEEWWQAACAEFTRWVDDRLRQQHRGVLPWERPVAAGQIDYWKVHAYALDRLPELLCMILLDGELTDGGTTWRGRHDPAGDWFEVSMLSGQWCNASRRRRGWCLVGLVADIYRMPSWRAAQRLAQQLGIEAVRHG